MLGNSRGQKQQQQEWDNAPLMVRLKRYSSFNCMYKGCSNDTHSGTVLSEEAEAIINNPYEC
jgi:hypothetical protein